MNVAPIIPATPPVQSGSGVFNYKNLLILGIIATIITITVATYTYIKYEIDKALDYCFKVVQVFVNHASLTNVNLTLTLAITNKSDLDINIVSQDYTVSVNGTAVSTINTSDPITIAAESTTQIPFIVDFNPSQVAKIALADLDDLISNQQNVIISISGTFKGGSGFITVSYPVDYSDNLKALLTPSASDC